MSSPSVVVHDIIVVTEDQRKTPPHFATGEFGRPDLFGGAIYKGEKPKVTVERLFRHIQLMLNTAIRVHRQKCCLPNGKNNPLKTNEIIRLVTNEFYFYTEKPLTLGQFEALMQRVKNVLQALAPNIHLLLGTFAIKTPDHKVLNVAPLIESGENGKLSLIVKNHPTRIDPQYKEITEKGTIRSLANHSAGVGQSTLPYSLSINQQECPFSFNNVVTCKTAGGISFVTCVDICWDHFLGIARSNLDALLTSLMNTPSENSEFSPPMFCSHVLISNTILIRNENALGAITQADPANTARVIEDASLAELTWLPPSEFGCSTKIYIRKPAQCEYLIMMAVNDANLGLVKYLAEHGADLNFEILVNNTPTNPILQAVTNKNYDLVNYLVSNHPINPEYINRAACYAVHKANRDIIILLQKHGLDIVNCQVEELTILDVAINCNEIAIVLFLIKEGASISKKNDRNLTPIEVAEEIENDRMVRFLKKMQELQHEQMITGASSSNAPAPIFHYSPTTELLSRLIFLHTNPVSVLLNGGNPPDLVMISASKDTLEEIWDNLIFLYNYGVPEADKVNLSDFKSVGQSTKGTYHITIPNTISEEITEKLDIYLELVEDELIDAGAVLKPSNLDKLPGLKIEPQPPSASTSIRLY